MLENTEGAIKIYNLEKMATLRTQYEEIQQCWTLLYETNTNNVNKI
jgi:hypothetical protein